MARLPRNSRPQIASTNEAALRSSVLKVNWANGVLKRSRGHMAYAPAKDRREITAKNNAPATT